MTVPVLAHPIIEWYCPVCGLRDQTQEPRPHTRFHTCPKLRFLSAPMYPADVAAKVELREREDYVGNEMVQLDPEQGRPVMSIVTTRDEGTDCIVFAPAATVNIEEITDGMDR